ncbi:MULTISPECIES: hypothetical protein [unclassified Undibacterium]|uniref:hypothetical protein n=1 Tax=unclassified Undibacterium TaxID=2630295 RepID=UPI002AC8C174|nr:MULTISPECIES: hypothetical protein [unclassified Undibacterium]MEB0141148.1 hypothetical protein [Undibacterium sp. CCC2.1]MEB0174181.1 hypothetical protein [Undibacterium sp. CCC1.1]MEB0178123.1 hypothetical protein [Undibacterium sp. CCC3.4]MEB0217326.1 hypothetical protein [Undibacterium sp. 5I2]WPX44634.1 hypothetical protein RHM61_05245 [Undibacterium sp. CCC3.4]
MRLSFVFKYLVFSAVCSLIASANVFAASIRLQAKFAYVGGFGPNAFATPEGAIAAAKQHMTGDGNFVVTEHREGSNGATYNGLPADYEMHLFANIRGKLEDRGWIHAASSRPLCPAGYELVRDRGAPHFLYSCYLAYGPAEVDLSEHDNDCRSGSKPPFIEQQVGNPIAITGRIKIERELDYQSTGLGGLRFERQYRSDRKAWTHNYQHVGIDLSRTIATDKTARSEGFDAGCHWADTELGKTCFLPMPSMRSFDFFLQRANGRSVRFGDDSGLTAPVDINDRIEARRDANDEGMQYLVYNAENESKELYDSSGHLISITDGNGNQQTLNYAEDKTLRSVSDAYGKQLLFDYDASGRLIQMTDPGGGIYRYAYDEASSVVSGAAVGNLTSVIYPDGKKRIYWYNEADKTNGSHQAYALTGISDENGARFATFTYTTSGEVNGSEHAGGVAKYRLSCRQNSCDMTDPLGAVYTYQSINVAGVLRPSRQYQPAVAGSVRAEKQITYDENANPKQTTDFNGRMTTYSYDLRRNLETSRVEAAGTPYAKTTTTSWHADFRLPLQIDTALLRTRMSYDNKGNLLTLTEQATTDSSGAQGAVAIVSGLPRTWTYTYNARGQLLTVTGPRTDIRDVTAYAYDTQGQLTSVTNAAGHVTSFCDYDPHGHLGTITDPNGMVTKLSYTPRGWLASRVVSADGVTQTTSYDYDGVGQMTQVTLPDHSHIRYTYDDAHRLTALSDSLGNSITYTLDNMGNRITEAVNDASGQLTRQITRVYDTLNHLQQVTGAVQ